MQPQQETPQAPEEREPCTLQAILDHLLLIQQESPKLLQQPAQWISEQGSGTLSGLWVLTENHINPSGEGLEPVSNYLPGEEEDFDPKVHMTTEELLAENIVDIGTIYFELD